MRSYRSPADLDAVGSLVRRVAAQVPRFNAWTFARFDIWSRWRIADAELYGKTQWQEDFALWDDRAAAFIGEAPNDGVLILAPEALELAPELLRWVEEHCRGDEPLMIEVNESNRGLSEALAAAGYSLIDGHFIPRVKVLAPGEEPIDVPAGFRLASIADVGEERYLDASNEVFPHGLKVEAYRYLAGARSAVAGLGVVAVDDDGVVASFANAWVDRDLDVAEFEPVGTRPGRQGHGLGSVVMRELENRLRRLGVGTATVDSWSASEGANRLYDALGYARVDRQRNWVRS